MSETVGDFEKAALAIQRAAMKHIMRLGRIEEITGPDMSDAVTAMKAFDRSSALVVEIRKAKRDIKNRGPK